MSARQAPSSSAAGITRRRFVPARQAGPRRWAGRQPRPGACRRRPAPGQARRRARRRHGRAGRRARARRARLQGRRLRAQGARRQGAHRSACPARAAGGRRTLPGEHGFRFFPGFYHHVPDSMRRIPLRQQRRTACATTSSTRPSGTLGRAPSGRADAQIFGIGPDPAEVFTRRGLRRMLSTEILGGRRRPAARARLLRRAPARVPHQLRRAPLRRVGERRLVGLRRRRGQVRGVPEGPRRAA